MNFVYEEITLPFKAKIERKITDCISDLGPKTQLRDACEYALLNGGKRFRPALVLMVAEALNKGKDVWDAALAVEFFHTASLIADDLPCMDDDDQRRNKPSLHKKFGETVALLASYALIASGYEKISKNAKNIPNGGEIGVLALENAAFNTGLLGASGGQFLDLFPSPELPEPYLKEIIHKKTVSLFEISFVLGWLFGGGQIEKLSKVKKLSEHFGMAFQILDDFEDAASDLQNKRTVNVVNALGKKRAQAMLEEEKENFNKLLTELNLSQLPDFCHLVRT